MAEDGEAVQTRADGTRSRARRDHRDGAPRGRPIARVLATLALGVVLRRQCARRIRVDGRLRRPSTVLIGRSRRRLVHPRRVPRQPAADEPHQPQPRADRRGPPVRCLPAGRRLCGGAGGAQPPGDPDQPRRRQDWRTAAGHPRGGGSHPMVAWGPGPRHGTARLYYTAMGGPAPNYHFELSYSDNEGRTWHRASSPTARAAGRSASRTWSSTPTRPAPTTAPSTSPTTGPRTRRRRRPPRGRVGRLRPHVRRDRDPEVPGARGYRDAWRIGYKLATAPDGSAYVAGYQLDMKHWRVSAPFAKGGNSNIGRIAFGVARLRFDRKARRLTHGPQRRWRRRCPRRRGTSAGRRP